MTTRTEAAKLLSAAANSLEERWERQVDPDGQLDPAERRRLAIEARSEHYRELGRKSGAARRAHAAAKAA